MGLCHCKNKALTLPDVPGSERTIAETSAELGLAPRIGAPTAATVPPGQCVFTEDWSPATLLDRFNVSHDTYLAIFKLPVSKPLALSTCACILAKYDVKGEDGPVVRPYTPVSTNALVGQFQLLIKVYPGGKMSNYIKNLPIGEAVDFKHIPKNVKIQYPFGKKHISMLCGGTGITPMIQALHAILGTVHDDSKVTLLLGNKTQQDILGAELLEQWATAFKNRFKLVHVLSEEKKSDSGWQGLTGFINRSIIAEHCAPPSADTLLMVCGPPPMYDALCGSRDHPELTGVLSEMGFRIDQVFKF